MTIEENLELLEQTKTSLRTAINAKGGSVAIQQPFSSYTEAVSSLPEKNFVRYLSNSSNFAIDIPSGTTAIRRGFEGLTELTGLTIPNTVERLVLNVFAGTKIRTITLPSSIIYLGGSEFKGCTSLSSATINCSVVSATMFSGCTALKDVSMPSVGQIATGAFSYCTNLSSVTIPDSCSSIGENAFYNCKSLKTVNIGTGCTSIGNRAFYGVYPNTVTLETMTITAPTPPTLGTDAINTSITAIYVPADSVAAYQAAWTAYETKIQAIS